MSVFLQPDVFVRIEQLETDNAPQPLPLQSGFSLGKAYEVLGLHAPSESSEAYLILRNDRDEMWFISNRHCRLVGKTSNRSLIPIGITLDGQPARASLPDFDRPDHL